MVSSSCKFKMNYQQSMEAFNDLLTRIETGSKVQFMQWLKSKFDSGDWDDVFSSSRSEDKVLESIRTDLREILPVSATSDTENILCPSIGPNADCNSNKTVHVDAFLYDDQGVDALVDEGKLCRSYCTKCGSQDISELNFITHSASAKQIKYIFQYLLPDLHGKSVLDIGSRTGAVLYGAFLYSRASKIYGVELDVSFCQLQDKLVRQYGMEQRIQIIHDNIVNQRDLINNCDVVILNNVFEFFMCIPDQEKIWCFLRQNYIRKGNIIISIPSLEDSLKHLQTGIDLGSWVTKVDTTNILQSAYIHLCGSVVDEEDSDLCDLHVYQVKG